MFLNLIGYTNGEFPDDLGELFSRAQQSFRSKKFERSETRLRWLLNRWVRMLKLDPSEWRNDILLRGLFVENLGWQNIAYLLRLSEARVRFLALDALLEQVSPEDLLDRPTRDCARNDLYLLDVVTRQAWTDRLGIYPMSSFEKHLGECDRCHRVFERTEKFRFSLLEARMQKLPTPLDWEENPVIEEIPSGFGIRRIPLPMRVVGSLGLGIVVFIGVISTPYLGKLISSSTSRVPIEVATAPHAAAPKTFSEPPNFAAPPPGPVKGVPPSPKPVPVVVAADTSVLKQALEEKEEKSESLLLIPQKILSFMEEKRAQLTTAKPPVPVAVAKPELKVEPKIETTPATISTPKPVEILVPVENKPAKPVVVAKVPVPDEVASPTTKIFFRWGARAQDPDRMSQKVLAWLKELGAVNAGELEFGALYRGGRYFHFTIPKASYEGLLSNIRTLPLTDFTGSAAESDRTIPGDQSRIVFWLGPTDR
ncbi:MAG: hypothetical protein ABIR96_10085 [Bdellovibrionota bacterium]